MNNKEKLEALKNKRAMLIRRRKSVTNQKDLVEINKTIKDLDDLITFWSKNV